MTLTRRGILTRIGFVTTSTVALAGCSGSSENSGSRSAGGTAGTDAGSSATDPSGGDNTTESTPSYDHELTNELNGAVALVSQKTYTKGNTLYVQAEVRVTDADAIDGHLHLQTELFYSKITAGNDVDILTEYESGTTYTLTTQFSDADPEKVERYTLVLAAVSDDPPNN